MITDIPISNRFKTRDDWALKASRCKKYGLMSSGVILNGFNNYSILIRIVNEVLEKTGTSRYQFMATTRLRRIVEVRHMYFKRAKELTKDMPNVTLSDIGSMTKNGSHSNVLYGIRQVSTVPSLIKKYNELFN